MLDFCQSKLHALIVAIIATLSVGGLFSSSVLAQDAVGRTGQNVPYIVDGMRLGQSALSGDLQRSGFTCGPSDQFEGSAWCNKRQTQRNDRGTFSVSSSVLLSAQSRIIYAGQSYDPAYFSAGEIKSDLDRLNTRYNEQPRVIQRKTEDGALRGIIAYWGSLAIKELDEPSRNLLATGASPKKGILYDFFNDLPYSARNGHPVYSVVSGTGYVWIATIGQGGRGKLRFFMIEQQSPLDNQAAVPSIKSTERNHAQRKDRGFMFTGSKVISLFNTSEFIELGESLPLAQLPKRLTGLKIQAAYGEDCAICATLSNADGELEVAYDGEGLKLINIASRDKNAVDALGNRVGTPLREALGGETGECELGMDSRCQSKIPGLSYLIGTDSCGFEITATGPTPIPPCALIEGFSIFKEQISQTPQDLPKPPPIAAQSSQKRGLSFSDLPTKLQKEVQDIRKECSDLNEDHKLRDVMQGIEVIDLDGRGARDIMVDNEGVCSNHLPGANCTNRGCDLQIWKQTGERSWTKIFNEHLYAKFISIDSNSARFKFMAVSIYAGDPKCRPIRGRDYSSGQSCDLVVTYGRGQWIWQRAR